MKDIKDILFIIQARLNSQRLPNKMLKPFKGSNLFGMAMTKVLLSEYIPKENFYVSVYEQELIDEANKLGVNVFKRSHESANNDNDLRKIYEWHDKLPFKYVIKINACSPLLKIDTINEFTRQFVEQKEENLFGVIEQKDYFWNKEGLMITPWPEDQTIMNTKAVEPTYKAAHVLYASRMDIIKDYKFMGDFFEEGSIKLFPMNELEAFDIDYEWQFKLAENL
jgi:CMP-N-acetylneuraminic acid synthetase